jgi:hypothetical protein
MEKLYPFFSVITSLDITGFLNSGPHACYAGALPHEPPLPRPFF